jgi:DHA1 family bicyclomycin/chloramphenicol resistance-like MFS transporter
MSGATHPGDLLSRRRRIGYVLILGALTALGPFTVDMYIPAFPSLATAFDVTESSVQLTLTATSIGFAIGQLVLGPWSDVVGRRLPLLLTTELHIGASLAILAAPGIEAVTFLRILQGIGAAGGAVVSLAVVRDLFGGLSLVRMLSRLALVSGMAPIFAPIIGSQVLLVTDWTGIFVFLSLYGLVVLAGSFALVKETHPRELRMPRGHRVVTRYRSLLTDTSFVGAISVGGFTFAGIFAYLAATTFLLQQVYGFSAQQFGLAFGANSVGIVIGVQLSSRLVRLIAPQWMIAAGSALLLVSSAAILLFAMADGGLWGLLVPLWVFVFSCGLVLPCVQVVALAPHATEAGTAASLMGAANSVAGGIAAAVIGRVGTSSAIPMATFMIVCAVMSLIVVACALKPWQATPVA